MPMNANCCAVFRTISVPVGPGGEHRPAPVESREPSRATGHARPAHPTASGGATDHVISNIETMVSYSETSRSLVDAVHAVLPCLGVAGVWRVPLRLLEWDAQTYDRLPLPHERWGRRVIDRLGLRGDETVIDLGCGTGRDCERLLHALPRGRIIAVDGSQQMLQALRTRLGPRPDRVEVLHADLRAPFASEAGADAAMSVATLQWLPDHAAVFSHVAAALRPGGRFVAEAGGHGNCSAFRSALAQVSGDDGAAVWTFPDIDRTVTNLRTAGFDVEDVALVPDPIRLETEEELLAYLATVMLGAQLRELPEPDRGPFVRAVASRLDEPVIDYVRLQFTAHTPAKSH
jgi:trans-aconitate 2-methyltransferase